MWLMENHPSFGKKLKIDFMFRKRYYLCWWDKWSYVCSWSLLLEVVLFLVFNLKSIYKKFNLFPKINIKNGAATYLRSFSLPLPVFLGAIFPTFLPGGVVLPTDDWRPICWCLPPPCGWYTAACAIPLTCGYNLPLDFI